MAKNNWTVGFTYRPRESELPHVRLIYIDTNPGGVMLGVCGHTVYEYDHATGKCKNAPAMYDLLPPAPQGAESQPIR